MIAVAVALTVLMAWAERVETRLGGWTCDGVPVEIPHTWNAQDGADGSSNVFQDTDNSVAGRAYLRCSKTYRTELAEPTPGRRYFVRFDGASIRAMVAVNGREVGVHRGPFTAFAYEITGFLREHDNVLEVVVDYSKAMPRPNGLGYQGINLILMALGTVTFFHYLPLERVPGWLAKGIDLVSRYCMGIYCCHLAIGWVLHAWLFPHIGVGHETVGGCLWIWAASWLCCWLVAQIPGRFSKELVQ